ncbi:MAG: HpaII family restriction endonuclease [Muribaculaceae bacterium]
MIEYIKNILTNSKNSDKLADFFYPLYMILYNAKFVYNVDLSKRSVEFTTLDGSPILRLPASAFYEALIVLLEDHQQCDKVETANNFISKILSFNKAQISEPCLAKVLWIDCYNSSLERESTTVCASGDNTNFIFEVTGNMDDEKMEQFNNLFKETQRKGATCYDIATADRMQYLHQIGCDIQFVGAAKNDARTNLVKCGGMEMPAIIGGMLKKYYFENLSGPTSVEDCIDYLAENDIAGYGFDDLKDTYRAKIAHFLLCTFTGMRLGAPWNGRQEVNGGYIVVKNNGDVVAFHSTIADEFKDFLVAKMRMESPSHSRHKDMLIYKDGDSYFLKLALQLRFTLNR